MEIATTKRMYMFEVVMRIVLLSDPKNPERLIIPSIYESTWTIEGTFSFSF